MTSCEIYLKKQKISDIPEKDINIIYQMIRIVDPDLNGSNCEWLVDDISNKDMIRHCSKEDIKN